MNNLDISNDFQMLENKTLHRNPLAFKTHVVNKPSVKILTAVTFNSTR